MNDIDIAGRAGRSRRRFLKTAAAGLAAVLLLPAVEADAAKATKKAANYRDKPHGGQHCSKCQYFQSPHSCRLVAGEISPHGWCKFFKAPG